MFRARPLTFAPDFMFAEPATTSHEALYGAAATFLLVLAREVVVHFKDRKKGGVLGRIDQKLDASIREQRTFVDEQRKTNEHVIGRLKDVEHATWGVDKTNGVRGAVRELQQDMDELKRRGAFSTPPERPRINPTDVGSYSPPRSA